MRTMVLAAALVLGGCGSGAGAADAPMHIVRGSVPLDKGPDGNSVFIDAPDGLILVDTGRHPAHVAKLLAHARKRGRPVAAIVNTHWHLDHTTGNREILNAFPNAPVYASRSVDGALFRTFMANSRASAEDFLKSGKASAAQKSEIERAFSVMDDLEPIRPERPVTQSGTVRIAGKELMVRLAPFAATEGDVWLFDPATRTAIVGDLVVDIVPFMDTACAEGWRAALEEIAATPFETLIPGHGPAMDRARFLIWKSAFDRLVDCGDSDSPVEQCVAGWQRDAAAFIPDSHRVYVRSATDYYLKTRFRSSAEERTRYCRPTA